MALSVLQRRLSGVVVRVGVKRGLIAAVVAVAAVATMAEASSSGTSDSGGGDSSASAPAGDNSGGDATEAPADGVGIGQPAADGQFTFTVKEVKCGVKKVGPDMFEEKAQGQFCLVTMDVENTGDSAQLFDASSQSGTTDTGAQVEADGAASIMANTDSQSFLEQINPGNTLKDVVVVYDIAPDQTLKTLILHDSAFSGGVTVNVG